MFERMEADPPQALKTGASPPIVDKYTPFLEEIALKAELTDIFDARDLANLVYRTMRDLMPNETSEAVAAELHDEIEEGEAAKRHKQKQKQKKRNFVVCMHFSHWLVIT